MGQKLVITLDESTTNKFFELALEKTKAEVDSDCLPSGTSLQIDIVPKPYDICVSCEDNEIGIASVEVIDA